MKGWITLTVIVLSFLTTIVGWWSWPNAPYWFVIPIVLCLWWSIWYGVYLVMKDIEL